LIAEGLSNKEIGARLFVSENTVKTHASRLFDKLGAKRRTEAVQIGKTSRLLP
jgi:ATP/maltotriose-dependent transcriptional regulator MalT